MSATVKQIAFGRRVHLRTAECIALNFRPFGNDAVFRIMFAYHRQLLLYQPA